MRRQIWIAMGLLLACLLVAGLPAAAQDSRALWAKTYGGSSSDNGNLLKDNGDGTYFVSGTTKSTSGNGMDALLMKVDSSGTVLWQKAYGSTGDDYGGISATADGGFAVIFTGITTSAPLTIMKLDASGEISWQKTFGTAGDSFNSAQVLTGGGFLLSGSTFSFMPPQSGSVRLMKLDASGTILWQKKYESPTLLLQSLIAFPIGDGTYLANASGLDMGTFTVTNLLLKLDSNGGILWQKSFFVPAGQVYGTIVPSSEGGFLYEGAFNPDPEGDGKTDVLVAKLNASGDIGWQKTYGGTLDDSGYLLPISGGYILSGSTRSYGGGDTNSRAFLAKLDASGNVLWGKTYSGTQDDFLSAMVDGTGGYLLQGGTLSFGTGRSTNEDFWVVKVNESGDIQWQRAYGGTNEDSGSLHRLGDNGLLLTGDTKSVGAGDDDLWIWKLDSQGQLGFSCPLLHDTGSTAVPITLGTGTGTLETGTSDVTVSTISYTSATGSMAKHTISFAPQDACSGTPTLSATASASPTSGVAPLAVQFTGGASNGTQPYSWSWNFGDASTSAQQSPSHTYAAAGTYEATLTVTDATQATAQATVTITVTGGGVCTVDCSATVPSTGTAGTPVPFASTYSAPNCAGSPAYLWTFGDQTAPGTSQNPTHTYSTPGTYFWSFTVTVDGQVCTRPGTITITSGGGCTLTCTATVPTNGAADSPVAFASTATATGCTGQVNYFWTFGDESLPSMEQNPSHTYATEGTYEWTFMASAGIAAPCIKSGTIVISGGSCQVTCSTVVGDGTAGVPLQFQLIYSADGCAGPVSILWHFGDGATSAEQNPTHTYAAAGVYTWDVTVTADGVTCSRSGQTTISEGGTCVSDASFPDWKAEYWNTNDFAGNPVLTKNEPGLDIYHDWVEESPYPGCVNPDYFSVRWTRDLPFTSRAAYRFRMGSDDGSRLSVDGSPDLFSGFLWGVHAYEVRDIYLPLTAGTHRVVMEFFENEMYADALLQITPEAAPCSFTCEASAAPTSSPAPNSAQFSGSVGSYTCAEEPWYHWEFGDGGFADEANPVYTYAAPGTYTWSLVVTGEMVVGYRTGTVTVGGGGKPGDCNGDGTVSIGEVQKAINMFLGIAPVECGVDCNGDGTVSIGEVQKVINGFLGLAVSC